MHFNCSTESNKILRGVQEDESTQNLGINRFCFTAAGTLILGVPDHNLIDWLLYPVHR